MPFNEVTEYRTDNEKTAQLFEQNVVRLVGRMESAYEMAVQGIFNNPFGLTAQQAADSLGTRAEELFTFLGGCKQLVETHTNRTLTPVSNYGSVSNDGDGTVTITLN